MTGRAWVIMQNDYPKAVVTESEKFANKIKDKLAKEYASEYNEDCYWRVYEFKITEPKHHEHLKKVCSCGTVIKQCRCRQKPTLTIVRGCPSCKKTPA